MSQTQPARFSDMDLRIGQTVQMILGGPVEHKYFTRLIGYVEPEFMMLQVPSDHQWLASIREGQSLVVRLFSGVSLFEFDTYITALLLNPRNYLLLAFPKDVRETRIRAHERVSVRFPIDVISAPLGKAIAGARLKDLSGGGAAVWSPQALGTPDQRLLLGLNFDLKATGSHERVQMTGTIKSAQPHSEEGTKSAGYLHGIQFDSVEPRILLLINELPRGRTT